MKVNEFRNPISRMRKNPGGQWISIPVAARGRHLRIGGLTADGTTSDVDATGEFAFRPSAGAQPT